MPEFKLNHVSKGGPVQQLIIEELTLIQSTGTHFNDELFKKMHLKLLSVKYE